MKSFFQKIGFPLLCTGSVVLFGCSDSDSSSGPEEADILEPVNSVCGDYQPLEDGLGNTYCLDDFGNLVYSVAADGTILYPETPAVSSSSVEGDSLLPALSSSSGEIETYICGETTAPLNVLGSKYFYRDALGMYYYEMNDSSCTKIYLTVVASSSSSAELPSDTVSVSSSSAENPLNSSSSEIEVLKSSSSVEVIVPNGSAPLLTFSGSALTVENNNNCVDTAGTLVKILCAGDYTLTGTTSNYEIFVSADASDKVYLYLSNLSLTSPDDAAIYAQSADKVFLMLVDGTSNTLGDASSRTKTWSYTDEGEYKTDTTKAVVYSKKDLTIKGSGYLTVTASCADTSYCGNGIHTTKDLKIKDAPNISISAKKHAIKGTRSVEVEGGILNLTAGGDGIKADEDDATKLAEGKGYIAILGGTITITSKDDGIQASYYIVIADSATTPSITVNASAGKGIVSDSMLFIHAGILNVTSTSDDGIHSNLSIVFNGGQTTVSAGDDGIHADSALHVNNGYINVVKAVEGMEAGYMYFDGGVTSTYGTDDGWNAAGLTSGSTNTGGWGGPGGGMQSNSTGYLYIRGGYHYVSASGGDIDVLDANGTATQTGGVLILEIPTSSFGGGFMPFAGPGGGSSSGGCSTNGTGGLIDTDNGYTISGGVMLAFGSQTEEYPNCTATSYTNTNYYGSSNAAFKPQGSGSMILYGGSISSVSTVDVSGMNSVTFLNGLSYYYK